MYLLLIVTHHLYDYLFTDINGLVMPPLQCTNFGNQKGAFPCQMSGCSRARNTSTEKMSIRWFASKDTMVRHMNRFHCIKMQESKNELKRINLYSDAITQSSKSMNQVTSPNSIRVAQSFPCPISGCNRAKNASTEKTNIRWFSSKLERAHHLNTKHGMGLECIHYSSSNKEPSETPYLPPISREVKIKTDNKGYDEDDNCGRSTSSYSEPKKTIYLPALSPTTPSRTRERRNEVLLPSKRSCTPSWVSDHILGKNRRGIKEVYSCLSEAKDNIVSNDDDSTIQNTRHPIQETENRDFAYVCAFCNVKIWRKEIMNIHIWNKHFEWIENRKVISCPHCPYQSEYLETLCWHVNVNHLLTHDHLEKGYLLLCIKCRAIFSSLEDFESHKRKSDCKQKIQKSMSSAETTITNRDNGNTSRKQAYLQDDVNFQKQLRTKEAFSGKEKGEKEFDNAKNKKRIRFLETRNKAFSPNFSVKPNTLCNAPKSKRPQTFWEKYC